MQGLFVNMDGIRKTLPVPEEASFLPFRYCKPPTGSSAENHDGGGG
jgi:hypothetical protein